MNDLNILIFNTSLSICVVAATGYLVCLAIYGIIELWREL